MRMRANLILIALLALAVTGVSAQDSETSTPAPQSYTVCDWGLLVLEESGGPVQDVEIMSPAEFSGVGTAFTVSGEGEGLFEGNVIVEVFDTEANMLFSGFATVTAEEMGGRGPWSLDVDLGAVPEATRIVVNAYSTEPSEGEIIAHDAVTLAANSAFGLPYIDITSPLSGDDIAGLPLRIEGTAGALFENSFMLQVTDFDMNILAETPVQFAAPDIGLSGPWEAELDFTAEPGARLVINAYALSMEDGESVVASDLSIVTVDALRLPFERVLVVQVGDPILLEGEMCAATAAEFGNTAVSPVNVAAVRATESDSVPPQVTVEITGQKPSFCEMPFRVRMTKTGSAYTGEAYYADSGEGGICTRDLREFTVRVPLGTVPDSTYSLAVSGVTVDSD